MGLFGTKSSRGSFLAQFGKTLFCKYYYTVWADQHTRWSGYPWFSIAHSAWCSPSGGPGWSWGPNHGRLSLPLLSLHTAAWRNTGSHSCPLQDTPENNKTEVQRWHLRPGLLLKKWARQITIHRPAGDTRTAACDWDTGSWGCTDDHLTVCSCIVGFLTSQLHASAPSPLVCWTDTGKQQKHV